jgi:uncharacterized protein YjbJ (UPF0337 family)
MAALDPNSLAAANFVSAPHSTSNKTEEHVVDKDRIKGGARQAKGSVKEAIGKVTGDRKTEAEGATERTVGKVQSGVGKAKDAVRDAVKK